MQKRHNKILVAPHTRGFTPADQDGQEHGDGYPAPAGIYLTGTLNL